MNPRILALAASFVFFCGDFATAQSPLNLDFETPGDETSLPDIWLTGGEGYEVKLDGVDRKSGLYSLRMTRQGAQAGFGVATSTLPVKLAHGKTIKLSGAIKATGIEKGYAGLWLRVDGPNGSMLGFDNMASRVEKGETVEVDRGVRGTRDWKRYSIEVPIDPTATNINFGCIHTGSGTARFDALTLEIDGKPYDQVLEEGKAALALNPEQTAWLKAAAIPFDTAEAGHGFADLKPLKAMIGDAHIVSLGEATHGTAEFFKMKHRLTEFLASEMGFTVFAIEASMPEAFRLNDFVLRGEGDPKELLKGMYFWTWNTQEVLDMIHWMREFNKSGKGRIEFLGFDMQEPKVAAEIVREYVSKHDADYLKTLDGAYAGLKTYRTDSTNGRGQRDRNSSLQKLISKLLDVQIHLQDERIRLSKEGGRDTESLDWAIQNARVVVQAVSVMNEPGDYRDRCMAENVDWILDHRPKGTKIVLWAHNGHVAKRPGSMGSFLSEKHGKDMVVAGFGFHEGQYTAVARGAGLQANEATPSEAGSVEWAFHQLAMPRAFLDLRKVEKKSAASGWLTETQHRNIGALAMRSGFFETDLPLNYDLFIFFDKTTPSALLPPHRRD